MTLFIVETCGGYLFDLYNLFAVIGTWTTFTDETKSTEFDRRVE